MAQDADENVMKMDKFAGIMEMVLSLDKLDNTDKLEDERLSSILLRYHVAGSEEFMSFEPVAPHYKRLKKTGSSLP